MPSFPYSLQRSGARVDLANPHPSTLLIQDIAHNLAVEARFNGATRWEEYGFPYTVGQHSCLVSDILPQEYKLCGLLHDAPEAYIRDLHTHAKHVVGDGYKRLEAIFWLAMSRKFNLPTQIPQQVKHADMRLLVTEGRDLCHASWSSEELAFEPLPYRIAVWSPVKTKHEFLHRFYALTH